MRKEAIKFYKSRIHTTLSREMEANSLEEMLRKAISNKEPIKLDTASMAYTERKDGVLPQYDIRTDRWEIALQASDKVSRSNAAMRKMQDHPELYEHNEDGSIKMIDGKPVLIHTGGEA